MIDGRVVGFLSDWMEQIFSFVELEYLFWKIYFGLLGEGGIYFIVFE